MNEKLREIFLRGCNEIATPLLSQGFKGKQKGQTISKKASKDLTLEIYFQSSYRNSESNITIIPHINVFSKAVKEFDIKAYHNEHCSGRVYGEQLCYILGEEYRTWDLAKSNFSDTVLQLQNAIVDSVLPIFEVFYRSPEEIMQHCIEGKLDISLSYFLVFGDKGLANLALQKKIEKSSYKKRLVHFFNGLSQMDPKDIDPNYNEFVDAGWLKMAYLQGLRLKL
ncbi:MAG: DUF4304 domain-containing protein [Peptostreptococcaceae bacterium]|nr:DUF4304 domain-containing protein [Peptostreptococcaceae bacterium]